MKVIQWNYSKPSSPVIGVGRYENELFQHIKKLYPESGVHRVYRQTGRFRGSFCVSWVLRPPSRGFDIVHATFQTYAPVAFIKKPRKYILTVHDLIPMIYPSVIRDGSSRLQWMFTPAALKKVDHIIAISEFTKKEIIRLLGIHPERISVVYQGIDHAVYRPLNHEDCQRRFGLNPREQYILVVASNEEHKRMDRVVQVLTEIRKTRPDIKLVKIGYGQQLQGDGIINPGWVAESDMPALFNAVDVYLHTAEYEGFGLPILEAMACGTPVVVSNAASIPEVVGDCGRLIDLETDHLIEDYVQALLDSISSGRAPESVTRSQLFSWERMAQETWAVYQNVYQNA